MPLVVSSLTGDASDVFDWILSLNHGKPQDLTTLLQMLREHYCGSLTFRKQRNTIKNLCQKPNEAAIDFLIRVGTSVSNLAKDWKDELTEGELQALQYEVSVPLLVSRRPPVRPQATSLGSTRQRHSLPQLVNQMMRLVAIKIPCLMRMLTDRRLSLLTRKMRDYTSLVTSRKLYQMILFCKLEWLMLYGSRR